MAQTLRKFIQRAPRYVYHPEDGNMLRFALNEDREKTFSTEIRNISISGLAFSVEEENAPNIGDVIKVEFPLPGESHETAAWWGKVVRLEQIDPDLWSKNQFHVEVLVGVKFSDLPEQHRTQIKAAIDTRFKEIKKQEIYYKIKRLLELFVEHFWKLFIYALCAGFTLTFLWHFTRTGK